MKAVKTSPRAQEKLPDSAKNDREIVKTAVSKYAFAVEHASPELQKDREILLAAVQEPNYGALILLSLSPEIRDDYEIVLEAVKTHGCAIVDASERLKTDRTIVVCAAQTYKNTLEYASSFRNDREIVEMIMDKHGLEHVSDEFKDDKEFVMKAVKANGFDLMFASERLRDDYDVVLEAAISCIGAIDYASERLRDLIHIDFIKKKQRERKGSYRQ